MAVPPNKLGTHEGRFRIYLGNAGYGVRDERTGEFVDDALTLEEAQESARLRNPSLPVRLASAAIMAAAMLLGLWVVMMVVWGIA